MDTVLRTLGRAVSPAGSRARLVILIYHRVLAKLDPLQPGEPDAARFDDEIGLLARNFTVLPLSEAVTRLQSGDLPARAACVTFDDGYANNEEIALPVLLRYGVHATFFVATGYIDGGIMFNDKILELVRHVRGPALDLTEEGLGTIPCGSLQERLEALRRLLEITRYRSPAEREVLVERLVGRMPVNFPRGLMMTSGQVRSLHRAGMEIGAHTVTHPILTRIDLREARSEMAASKEQLEAIIRVPVRLFAYPNGRPVEDYGAQHVQLARELGFQGAVSTAAGAAARSADPYQLPRLRPWDRALAAYGLRLVRSYLQAGAPTVAVCQPGAV